MKKLITILLSIVTISLSAQKLRNPPKADAIGKESLWESFEKKDTYDILVRTKKIAILPVTSAYFAKKIDADSLQKFQNMLTNSSSAKVLYLDSPDAALNKAAEVSFQSIPFIIR